MGDSFLDISLKTEIDAKIAEVFKIYDHKNNNMIASKNVGSILRMLGCVPSEKEIQEIIVAAEIEEKKGIIHLATFLPCVKKLLVNDKMKPLSNEELLEIFKNLDAMNRGYILKDEFIHAVKKYGEEMTDDELKEMLNAAIIDSSTNHINYEVYSRKLTSKDYSIYEIAKKCVKKLK